MDEITKIRADLQITAGDNGDFLRTIGNKVLWRPLLTSDISDLSDRFNEVNTKLEQKIDRQEVTQALENKADKSTTYTKEQVDTKVNDRVAEVIGTAPDALNTLNELAQALGNDPNFSTTVLSRIGNLETELAKKLKKTTDTFTGNLALNGNLNMTGSTTKLFINGAAGDAVAIRRTGENYDRLTIDRYGVIRWKDSTGEKASLRLTGNNLVAKNLTVEYDNVQPTNLVTKQYVDDAVRNATPTTTLDFPRSMTVVIDSNNVNAPNVAAVATTPQGEKKMKSGQVLVYRNGLLQAVTRDYTVVAGEFFAVTFSQRLVSGEVIQFVYLGE